MTIALPIITAFVGFMFLFYIFATIMFGTKNKWFMANVKKFNPMVYYEKYSYKKGLTILIGATILLGVIAVGLLFFLHQWCPIIAVLLLSMNEAYRGAVYYVKVGDYKESTKHMLIHGGAVGYMVSWFVFTQLPAWLPAWILALIL